MAVKLLSRVGVAEGHVETCCHSALGPICGPNKYHSLPSPL